MEIKFTSRFAKQFKKSPLKIQKSFHARLDIFLKNKFDGILDNHKLTGGYRGYRSIRVTGDWRAVFKEYENGKLIYFDFLGTHSNLYKK